jgi:predicted Fe-Mo cluster-binding NifX family protein
MRIPSLHTPSPRKAEARSHRHGIRHRHAHKSPPRRPQSFCVEVYRIAMKLLVNVVTYNPIENNTKTFLEMICKFAINYNIDTIIIDNSSSSISRKFVKSIGRRCGTVITPSVNLHYPGSVTLILKLLTILRKYEIAIIMNDDIKLIEKNSINFIENLRHANYDIINGILLAPSNKIYSIGGAITFSGYPMTICSGCSQNIINTLPSDGIMVSYPDGSFFALKTSVITNLINDELINILKYRFPYIDDVILGISAWKNGLIVGALPFIIGTHFISLSYGKSNILVTNKKRSEYYGVARGFQIATFKRIGSTVYLARDLLRNSFHINKFIKGFVRGLKIKYNIHNIFAKFDMPLAKDSIRTLLGKLYPSDLMLATVTLCYE